MGSTFGSQTPAPEVTARCMGCMELRDSSSICRHCGWHHNTQAQSILHLRPETVLNGCYVVGRVLGQGGFGITYIAWDTRLHRKVAIKEYFPQILASRKMGASAVVARTSTAQTDFDYGLQSFMSEGRILARFSDHPCIVSVFSLFEENGTGYLVMRYLEGKTLSEALEEAGGKIPYEMADDIMMRVIDGLREVHHHGLLHRDVSPDNIYLTRQGPVKILDFGAARLAAGERSQSLSVVLKEGYAPEEQYRRSGTQGPWTDVYATGATLYRAIAGLTPPPALDRLHEDTLKSPRELGIGLPRHAESALLRALSVKAGHRFQTMEQFQRELSSPPHEAPLHGSDSSARETHNDNLLSADMAGPGKSSMKSIAWIGGSVAVVVLLLIASLTYQGKGTRTPEPGSSEIPKAENSTKPSGSTEPAPTQQHPSVIQKPVQETDREILARISSQIGGLRLSPDDGRIEARRTVACFPGFQLLEVSSLSSDSSLRWFFLYHPQAIYNLDTSNAPIYRAVEQIPAMLTADTVADYVRFFFTHVRGKDGRFLIVEHANDVRWRPDTVASIKAGAAQKITPVQLLGQQPDGTFTLLASMIFKNSLFSTNVLVAKDGLIKLTNEKVLLSNLPVTEDTFALAGANFRDGIRTAENPWPVSPLIAGSWTNVNPVEANRIVGLLEATPEAQQQRLAWGTFGRMRLLGLPFYSGTSLIELETTLNGNPGTLAFLRSPQGITFLNGKSPAIHRLNSQIPIVLNTAARADAYLRFFCGAVEGEEGPFQIVETLGDLRWRSTPISLSDVLRPLSVQPHADKSGHWQATAIVSYGRTLFRANFEIQPAGMIEMKDDQPLRADLPILTERFRGFVRSVGQ